MKIKEATENAEQRTKNKEGAESFHAGRNPNAESSTRKTFEENGDGSRIPKTMGEAGSGLQQDSASERQHPNEDEVNSDKNTEVGTYTLTNEETGAILAYKSGGSYMLNAKRRERTELDEHEQKIIKGLNKALKMSTENF